MLNPSNVNPKFSSRGRAGHHRGDWWWNEEVEKKVGTKKGAYARLVVGIGR